MGMTRPALRGRRATILCFTINGTYAAASMSLQDYVPKEFRCILEGQLELLGQERYGTFIRCEELFGKVKSHGDYKKSSGSILKAYIHVVPATTGRTSAMVLEIVVERRLRSSQHAFNIWLPQGHFPNLIGRFYENFKLDGQREKYAQEARSLLIREDGLHANIRMKLRDGKAEPKSGPQWIYWPPDLSRQNTEQVSTESSFGPRETGSSWTGATSPLDDTPHGTLNTPSPTINLTVLTILVTLAVADERLTTPDPSEN
jgi:hypothetical protein